MKTYEEMARDVLRRRDEELQKQETLQYTSDTQPEVFYPTKNKKRGLLPAIAIPCAAAVVVAGTAVGLRYGGQCGIGSTSEDGAGLSGTTLPDDIIDIPEIADRINILEAPPETVRSLVFYNGSGILEPVTYVPFTASEMDDYYGLELGCLSVIHSDWESSFGGNQGAYVYNGDDEDRIASDITVGGRKILSSHSSISYKSDNGSFSIAAERVGVNEKAYYPFDGVDSSLISYINKMRMFIFRDSYYEGSGNIDAVIDYGDTLVCVHSTDMDDDSFLAVLDEFTAANPSKAALSKDFISIRKPVNILNDVSE